MSVVIKSLSYQHPSWETLIQNLDISLPKGGKAGIVGNNGAGKSTLLQLIAGRLQPSEGNIILPERPGYVPQHLGQYDHLSVAEALGAEKKLKALRAILGGDASADHFASLDDDWDVEEKVRAAMSFWRLEHVDVRQTMKSLSGGEKTKVFLSGILVHAPGVILLDEPTNHLDTFSRDQLYDFISKSKSTILAVSHDKALLNLLNITLELSGGSIEWFGGNYDLYRRQKEGQLTALQSRVEEQQKALKQARQKAREVAEQRQKKDVRAKAHGRGGSMPRIVAGGLKSKAEQSSAKLRNAHNGKIGDLSEGLRELRSQIRQSQVLKIDLGASGLHEGKVLLNASDLRFSYGGKDLWVPLSFQVRSGDRIQIEGSNGSGKTTLLKIIMGRLSPAGGTIFNAGFSYLYLDQDYTMVDGRLTVFEQVRQYNDRSLPEHELKSLLHYLQFPADLWDRKCSGLSGGEKMKLTLCCLAASNNTSDVLILDEPANNLDLQSLEVLTQAVKDFRGTLLVTSHDRCFIDGIGINSSINLG